jgi:hypothetical protein
MTAPTKQTSRWGSFLQQAVAGVESRLDNILTDAEDGGKPSKPATLTPDSGSRLPCRTFSGQLNNMLQVLPAVYQIAAERVIDCRND